MKVKSRIGPLCQFLTLACLCAGCPTQDARHLPANPLLIPLQGATTAFENASYAARRRTVEKHVLAQHVTLLSEIAAQHPGPALREAYRLARVPAAGQSALQARLRQDRTLYTASPKALVVALMVHGG